MLNKWLLNESNHLTSLGQSFFIQIEGFQLIVKFKLNDVVIVKWVAPSNGEV